MDDLGRNVSWPDSEVEYYVYQHSPLLPYLTSTYCVSLVPTMLFDIKYRIISTVC